jgi:hypothetical protein
MRTAKSTDPADQIPKSSWSAWWYGTREVSASYRVAFNAVTNNFATKWLEPSLVTNRLACHLCCFDLANIWQKQGQEKAVRRAWEILQTVHHDWSVNIRGEVAILNGTVRSAHQVLDLKGFTNNRSTTIQKSITIDLDKANACRLIQNAGPFTLNYYDPLNPSSIIPFLICYALEAMHSEKNLDQTISIDLTSALYTCVFLLSARQRTASSSGSIGKAAFALLDFWFDANDVNEDNLWTLTHALGDMTGDLELDNLIVLRETYREVMKLSGLSVTELCKLATDSLT